MVIADANLALLLVVVGLVGIYTELLRPGLIAPGVVGCTVVTIAVESVHLRGLNAVFAAAIVTPLAVASVLLVCIAARARRNKRNAAFRVKA